MAAKVRTAAARQKKAVEAVASQVVEQPKPRSRKRLSADGSLTTTTAWHQVLSENFEAKLSDEELEEKFRKLMGVKSCQPASRIRSFFNAKAFPYFTEAGCDRPTEKLPKFVDGKPVGRKKSSPSVESEVESGS